MILSRQLTIFNDKEVIYMGNIGKETYIGIVKFTLESMVDLAKSDKNYNLTADTIHYYETTIKPEMQISEDEFLELCKEVGIK